MNSFLYFVNCQEIEVIIIWIITLLKIHKNVHSSLHFLFIAWDLTYNLLNNK